MPVVLECQMFVWCSLCVSVCMLTVSNALFMSSATAIVSFGGLLWLKHVAMVLSTIGDHGRSVLVAIPARQQDQFT